MQYTVIAQHPVSRTNNEGGTATFSVTPRISPATYQWFKDGTALAGQTNATLSLANVQTGDAANYTVVVGGNYYGSQTSAVATLTVNSLPVVNAPAFARYWFGGFKARTNAFTASDQDGDALTLTVASSSASGAEISRRGAWVFYEPPPSFTNSDTFGFTFTDARGAATSGSASVAVNSDTGPPRNLVQSSVSGAETLNFVGVPGRSYAVQFADDLHPVWQTFTNIAADALGEFTAFDSPPKSITNRVYRSTVPRP